MFGSVGGKLTMQATIKIDECRWITLKAKSDDITGKFRFGGKH